MMEPQVDGTCRKCGSETLCRDALSAPKEVADPTADYYVYCSNDSCEHRIGTCVGDQECPPEWASHSMTAQGRAEEEAWDRALDERVAEMRAAITATSTG